MHCPTGKQTYPTPNAAWVVLSHIKSRGRYSNAHSKTHNGNVYRCAECSGWYITGRGQAVRREEVA